MPKIIKKIFFLEEYKQQNKLKIIQPYRSHILLFFCKIKDFFRKNTVIFLFKTSFKDFKIKE